jgi:hypothetical protein
MATVLYPEVRVKSSPRLPALSWSNEILPAVFRVALTSFRALLSSCVFAQLPGLGIVRQGGEVGSGQRGL